MISLNNLVKISLTTLLLSSNCVIASQNWNIIENKSSLSKWRKSDNVDFNSDKAWHLKKIRAWHAIYNESKTIRPQVRTAILDAGISKHEDLYYVNMHPNETFKKVTHGNMTMGAAFGLIGNKRGSRGITNPSIAPQFYYGYEGGVTTASRIRNIANTISLRHFKIINLSYYLDYNEGMSDLTTQCTTLKKNKGDYNEISHLHNIQSFRKLFSRAPKNLFIISAGNSYGCSDKLKGEISKNITDNAAIHYELVEKNGKMEIKYSPLGNVIVVGALKKGDTIQSYSFRGQPVDILAPASLFTTPWEKVKYGEGRGTSVAAPLVTGVAAALAYNANLHDPVKLKDVLVKGASEKVSKIPVLNMESSKNYADENYPMK